METVKFKKDLQCLGHRIRKRVISSTEVFHIAMSFPFMQPLPDFRSSCFNPTSYQIVRLLSCIGLMENDTHFYQVSSTLSSLQKGTLPAQFEV